MACLTMQAAQAQSVFDEGSLSEAELIQALAPDCPPEFTCRQITVTAVAPKPRRAALLITFETNSTELTASARTMLSTVASALQSERLMRSRFLIEGHADPRGTPSRNHALSAARAQSVRDHLVRVHGVSLDRLEAVGKGSAELMNRENVVAPENRRVTFVTRTD